jgi:hypothetical protein
VALSKAPSADSRLSLPASGYAAAWSSAPSPLAPSSPLTTRSLTATPSGGGKTFEDQTFFIQAAPSSPLLPSRQRAPSGLSPAEHSPPPQPWRSSGASSSPTRACCKDCLACPAGASDLEVTARGCQVSVRASSGDAAEEHFSYVSRALDGLCAKDPARSICRAGCPEPCRVAPESVGARDAGGCSVAAYDQPYRPSVASLIILALLRCARNRRRQRAARKSASTSVGIPALPRRPRR